MSERGDILIGKNTVHPIVFLREEDEYYFYGCMLTHSNSNNYKNNIALLSKHFETHDINKNKYRIIYDDSFFVNLTLIKKTEWGPFEKVGKLSEGGIAFLEKHLKRSNIVEWREYITKI